MKRKAGRQKFTPPAGMIFSGVCECGCGQKTAIAWRSTRGKQWAGYPLRFIQHHQNIGKRLLGDKSIAWKGGRHMNAGYVRILCPHESKGQKTKYDFEHRLVMEQIIGRKLFPTETVHHKNGKKDDNRPCNLELFTRSHSEGQRVTDLVKWAKELLALYPHL